MDEITLKFNALDNYSQKLVLDFIEMLLNRQPLNSDANTVTNQKVDYKTKSRPPFIPNAEPSVLPFDETFKQRLLEMPSWTDREIKEFDDAISTIKNWNIEEW